MVCDDGRLQLRNGLWLDPTSTDAAAVAAQRFDGSHMALNLLMSMTATPLKSVPCLPHHIASLFFNGSDMVDLAAMSETEWCGELLVQLVGSSFGYYNEQADCLSNKPPATVSAAPKGPTLFDAFHHLSSRDLLWWYAMVRGTSRVSVSFVNSTSPPCNHSSPVPASELKDVDGVLAWADGAPLPLSAIMDPADVLHLTSSASFLPCLNLEVCAVHSIAPQCSEGNSGVFCAACASGWHKSRVDEPCLDCSLHATAHMVGFWCAVLAYFLGFTAVLVFDFWRLKAANVLQQSRTDSDALFPVNGDSQSRVTAHPGGSNEEGAPWVDTFYHALLKTLMNLSHVTWAVALCLPPSVASVNIAFLTVPYLHNLFVICALQWTFATQLLWSLLLPLLVLLMTALLMFILLKLLHRHVAMRHWTFARIWSVLWIRSLVYVAMWVAPFMVRLGLEALVQSPWHVQHTTHLHHHPDLSIDDSRYSGIQAMALLALGLGLGLPLAASIPMNQARRPSKSHLNVAFGFLFTGYSSHAWYFEVLQCALKGLLLVSATVPTSSRWRSTSVCLVLFLYLLALLILKPFSFKPLNALFSCVVLVLFAHGLVTLISAAATDYQAPIDTVQSQASAFFTLTGVGNAAVLGALIAAIVLGGGVTAASHYRKLRNRKKAKAQRQLLSRSMPVDRGTSPLSFASESKDNAATAQEKSMCASPSLLISSSPLLPRSEGFSALSTPAASMRSIMETIHRTHTGKAQE